ncbi:hypothetical protein CIW49_28730 [Mycolicibacterium sp. P1-18]|uniref:DUF6286 domain-containing protein n=1 Tax=Mycolicibacterium sp. P1-18 TaxID=2024615 RepID=UPI0011F26162|nr:DUF6286 domain-containing protein [Mycolicibacterium sp. P1-18]KAA0092773.1 hypothetical protein CIW49_28730 [Mycolicibacterium sp. P1-18]
MTTTREPAAVTRPAPGRPPVAAPAAGYVGALIALLILALGAVALRDAAVHFGWLTGTAWIDTAVSGLDGLTYQGWMLPAGIVAILVGLWWVSAAIRPRRRTALEVPATTSVWIAKGDLARLASAAADSVPGVLDSRASASLRTVKVTANVTAGDPALKAAITTAVADAVGGFTTTTPRITVRTRTGAN